MQPLTVLLEPPPRSRGVRTGFPPRPVLRNWTADDIKEDFSVQFFKCAFGCGFRIPVEAEPGFYTGHLKRYHKIRVSHNTCPIPNCLSPNHSYDNLRTHFLKAHHRKYYICPFRAPDTCERLITGDRASMLSRLNYVHRVEDRTNLRIEAVFVTF